MQIGWAKIDEGQGEIPAKQRAANVGRGRVTMAGVGRFQRRGPLLGQHRLIHGGAQHQRVRRHQPPRVDVAWCHFLQEALSHWSRSGHDHWPCLHHSRRRYLVVLCCLATCVHTMLSRNLRVCYILIFLLKSIFLTIYMSDPTFTAPHVHYFMIRTIESTNIQ